MVDGRQPGEQEMQILSKNCQIMMMMLEMEYSSFGVNTMHADALAPKVASASAGMVLIV